MVKKINPDGSTCKKCDEIDDRLRKSGKIACIDRIVYADSNNPSSEGMILAAMYGVEDAPFFIVERHDEEPSIYTVYLKFVKEVLASPT